MQDMGQILLEVVKIILVYITPLTVISVARLEPVRQPTGGLVVINKDREHLIAFSSGLFFIFYSVLILLCMIVFLE